MATIGWDNDRTKTLSILSSGTETDVLDLGSLGAYGGYIISFLALSLTHEGTVNPQVAVSESGPYCILQSSGANVVINANRAGTLTPFNFRYLKFVSSQAETAQRDFVLVGSKA